ncbi:hypothetical protein [Marivirga harenae]|uniref:hypothetical protein n=1 Tax=Marivirga harenae TaxID=2010992 RepID=UPI0026E034BF|nr:hypothetical protein [Marivirga harenae]WKV12108.1 hypothetical protein Q3Y49_18080 [Marivirga harenae]|tara:strand:- start:221556 stop:221762 length:207 start_codon:yes stop_codon:yes gene_type:complete
MIKAIIRTPWGFMRWLRLAIGLYLVFVGITESEIFAGSVGVLFTFLALLNQGCGGGSCASGSCDVQNK